MKSLLHLCAVVGLTATLVSPLAAQGTFEILGPGTAQSVSPDGENIAGFDGLGGGPAIWNSGVWTVIGEQDAVAISADGSVAAGNVDDGGLSAGGRWQGSWTSIGGIIPCDFSLSTAYDMDNAGDVLVGLGWNVCDAFAFRWTAGGGIEELPRLTTNSARANVISGDAGSIGGWEQADNGQRRAALWVGDATDVLILENTPGNAQGAGEVWGLSTDGTYACGSALNDLGPFVWSQADGAQYLGVLPGAAVFDTSNMEGINDAGNCAVGWQGSNFGTPFRATIWTPEGGLELLADFLTDRGVVIPFGDLPAGEFALGVATDISPDGRTIIGWSGDFFSGQTAWRVTLDEPERFLVVGAGAGNQPFDPGLHQWDTQVGEVEDYYPTLMENLPEFVLPSTSTGVFGGSATVTNGRTFSTGTTNGVEPWMLDGFFSVQVVMWNPGVFPWLPEQYTYGLFVNVTPNGDVKTRPFGDGTGMEIWAETDVNAEGQPIVRFPFTIPGIQ